MFESVGSNISAAAIPMTGIRRASATGCASGKAVATEEEIISSGIILASSPRIETSCLSRSTEGMFFPLSHFCSAPCVMCRASARACCVSPFAFLAALIRSPMSFIFNSFLGSLPGGKRKILKVLKIACAVLFLLVLFRCCLRQVLPHIHLNDSKGVLHGQPKD